VEEGYDGGVLESFPVTEKHVLVLASNSARRRQLLALAGWAFSVSVADVDESQHPNEVPADYVLRLAEAKARAVVGDSGQIVLAADTTVVDEGGILGKPKDHAEAIKMLTRLRGHMHQVYTGVALLRLSDGLLIKDLCITDVPMRDYSDEEINAYVQTGDPLDKAGSYAIQHPGFRPVDMPSHGHEGMRGCYANVMGLPLCHVIRMMRKTDSQPNTDAFAGCETLLEYRRCPVSEAILRGEM
jgi:septum formation protein